ncbi:hypothetical protein ACXET9_09145 [Brachybacterium sp. DNPG3]
MPGPDPDGHVLAPGASLFTTRDGVLMAVDVDEQFAELDIEHGARPLLLDVRAAGGALPEPARVAERWPRLAEALEGLRAEGYLVPRRRTRTVGCRVEGSSEAADVLRAALGPTLVVAATWPMAADELVLRVCHDLEEQRLALAGHDLPVLIEGASIAVGPFHPVPGKGPGLEDLRRRRLAAHPAPELLEELWRDAVSIPAHRGARPARSALLAAAAWILAELADGGTLLAGHQALVTPDLSVGLHPVLPYPRPEGPHPARPDLDPSLLAPADRAVPDRAVQDPGALEGSAR